MHLNGWRGQCLILFAWSGSCVCYSVHMNLPSRTNTFIHLVIYHTHSAKCRKIFHTHSLQKRHMQLSKNHPHLFRGFVSFLLQKILTDLCPDNPKGSTKEYPQTWNGSPWELLELAESRFDEIFRWRTGHVFFWVHRSGHLQFINDIIHIHVT